MKSVYDDYASLHNPVPGVFIDMDSPAVYIVDDQGEVCCWVDTEFQEDPTVIGTALIAVSLAAKHGAAYIRSDLNKFLSHPLE